MASKAWNMQQALWDLECGVTPELFRPAKRVGNGRPNDELRIWRVRSLAVLAWQARVRKGMSRIDGIKDIKKRHPKLDRAPYVTGREAKFQTSLDNWERKLSKIRQGDHLDPVADEYWNLNRDLEARSIDDASYLADELLRHALH